MEISKFRICSIRILLAVTLFMAIAVMPGNAPALASIPASEAPNACPAVACAYLPLLSYIPVPPVEISFWFGRDRSGKCIARGEIENTSEEPVYALQIELQVYDQNDQLLVTRIKPPLLPATFPGQLNPFEIGTVTDCLYGDNHGEVKLAGWEPSSAIPYAPLSVDITPKEAPPENLIYSVTARIQNDGPLPLENIQASIWSMQQVYNLSVEKIADAMLPGEVITVTHNFYDEVYADSVHATVIGVVPQQP